MKEIKLKSSANLKKSTMLRDPIYAFESNYCFTSKYSCWRKVVYEASVTVLLFHDRIALIPRSREGFKVIDALKKLIDLKSDGIISSAQSVIVEKNIVVSDYVDRLTSLLSNFDADANFGLYGFFAYELINMKLGADTADMPLGIFCLPEIMSVNQGPVFQYSMQGDCDVEPKLGESPTPDDKDVFDLFKFSKGEAGVYEHLYDLSQDNIRSRKIRSINPSFTISKATKASSYEIFERLKSMNPAPYNFYMSHHGCDLVGSSPAMFMRMKSNYVETSPICGTIERGKSDKEDLFKINKLLGSEKDDYELSECIRSDIEAKKISCEKISVVKKKEIEKFSNVFHTSSHITGLLQPGRTFGKVIEDHFSPSTIVGSPVATAARIIADNEVRNWYGGAFGYILVNNEIDFGTMIRCATIYRGIATTRVGCTITKYSRPEFERDELHAKASLILGVL